MAKNPSKKIKPLADMTEVEISDLLTMLAAEINSRLPPGHLFNLLVFEPDGTAQYVSNGNRNDVVRSIKDFLKAMELRTDVRRDPA